MRLAFVHPLALACASIFLASCGGGESHSSPPAVDTRMQPASVVSVTGGDTILTVALKASSDNLIEFTNSSGVISLTRPDGVVVTSIDDLPAALANYAWTKSASPAGHLRVRFKPGTYRLNRGWVWPAIVSGKNSTHQIVLEQTPRTTGEVVITGAEEKTGTYDASKQLSTASTDNRLFEQLWANGARAIRARTPDVGSYFYIKGSAQGWPQSGSTQVVGTLDGADVERQSFQTDDNGFTALTPLAAAQPAASDANGIVVMMHAWQVSKHKVAGVDTAGKRVRLSPAAYWPLGNDEGQRYFIENTESALNAPGEWFWSASGTTGLLKFKPFDSTTAIKFRIPRVEKLLTIQGDLDNSKWAQYVQFSAIKFRYTQVNMPSVGYIDAQADTGVSAAIELNDARNIQFVKCEVSHTGGYAFWLNKRVRGIWIEGSELFDLGAGGIKIGKSRPPQVFDVDWADLQDPNNTGGNIIYNNRIHNTGHVYPGSTGIWVGRSSDNMISSNLIKDTTYSGISVGWTWDTGPTMASGNEIDNNFLVNIGLDAMSDMGGIYLLGRAPNTNINGNVIKNVRAYDNQTGRGIYADEGSSELTVYNNIVLGTEGAGFLLHYGESNTVQSNAFANGNTSFEIMRRVAQGKPTTNTVPLTLTNNRLFPQSNAMVALSTDATLMSVPSDGSPPSWVPTTPSLSGNEVSSQFLSAGTSLSIPATLCTGCAAASSLSINDTSLLTVPTVSDLPLTKGSTVAKDWNTDPLSPTTSAARIWAGDRANIPARAIDFQASQWPLGSTAKADGRALPGWQVINQTQYYQSPTDQTVPVSIGEDSTGQHYLLLADTARTAFTWEPFIQTWMRYASGTAKVTFTAKFDSNSYLTHEWRSDDAGTTVGPRVTFVANGGLVNVIVNGATLTTVSTNSDATFEITSPVQAGQTWTLAVTQGGIRKAFSAQAFVHSNWTYVGPVLFISNANTTTTTAFKNIQIQKL